MTRTTARFSTRMQATLGEKTMSRSSRNVEAGVVERVTRRRLAGTTPRVIKASCNVMECNLNSKHHEKRSARHQPRPPIENCETKCNPDVVERTMQFDVIQSNIGTSPMGLCRPHTLQVLRVSLNHGPSEALNSSDAALPRHCCSDPASPCKDWRKPV